MNIAIVGRGRVGNGLFRALRSDGTHSVTAMGRRLDRARLRNADVVILAVTDDAIETVSNRIASELRPGSAVLHCAGARGTGVLEACAARGASVGVLHPMVSFPSKQKPPSLRGTTFVVNGSSRAVTVSRAIAKAAQARVVTGNTASPIYHASAALAANGAAALAFVAVQWLERLGFGRRDAEQAIGGLLQSVGQNVQTLGIPGALTGPVARGDAHTVDLHRRALAKIGQRALSTYDAVLPVILATAKATGLPGKRAAAIRRAAAKPHR